ncbi:MAG: J domain-containing protein [Sedimentisphaerales bacterium]|nr:J domain-containing protein [Sedimentisphaerales bacterium]
MKKDDYEFKERISRDLETRRAAYKILGVEENAGNEALKKAYRRASLRYHPDHNPSDSDAHRKFLLIKCAYKLLAEDEPCDMLLEEIKSWRTVPDDKKYRLDNPWGHFLWWREKFF